MPSTRVDFRQIDFPQRCPARVNGWPALLVAAAVTLGVAPPSLGQEPSTLRVETEVFVDDAKEPVARSLTLFRDGVAWDFLEAVPEGDQERRDEPSEIVLHDPARDRTVLVDTDRRIKTQVDSLRLERLRASLGTWARRSEDPVMRWAGGPDFTDGMEATSKSVVLVGPRVRYTVDFERAATAELADEYRRFADTAILVKALVHPGGLPPLPRLAINRRVAEAGGIPVAVRLERESKIAKIGGRSHSMRSVHKVLPSWLASDHKRIAAAEEMMAVAAPVELAEYAGADSAAGLTEAAADRPTATVR